MADRSDDKVYTYSLPQTETPAGVTISESELEINEGSSGTYTVVLDTEPTENVTIDITASTGSDLTFDSDRLTFTPQNWQTAQEVTVNAGQDDDVVNDEATISHGIDSSSAIEYADLINSESVGDIGRVDVTIIDDDSAVTLNKSELEINEGSSGTYTIVLDFEPTGDVTIDITASPGSDLTFDSNSLTFTPQDWQTAQEVTVTAGEDVDVFNDEATISHSVGSGSAPEFVDLTSRDIGSVDVTVLDDDPSGTIWTSNISGSPESYGCAENRGDTGYHCWTKLSPSTFNVGGYTFKISSIDVEPGVKVAINLSWQYGNEFHDEIDFVHAIMDIMRDRVNFTAGVTSSGSNRFAFDRAFITWHTHQTGSFDGHGGVQWSSPKRFGGHFSWIDSGNGWGTLGNSLKVSLDVREDSGQRSLVQEFSALESNVEEANLGDGES